MVREVRTLLLPLQQVYDDVRQGASQTIDLATGILRETIRPRTNVASVEKRKTLVLKRKTPDKTVRRPA